MMNGGLKFDIKKIDYSKTREQLSGEARKIMNVFCENSIIEAIKEKEGVDMKYEYLKGSAKDFEGAAGYCASIYCSETNEIIAERRPITDESDLNECVGQQSQEEFIEDFVTFGKYDRQCKGVMIDVYDVLQAFEVVNPALQHLIKKALCAGLRGHKKREQDLVEILESAKRAIELEGK